MQAVVKTPLTEIRIKGKIPERLLSVLKEEYGPEVQLIPEEDDERLDVFETDWYRGTKERLSPGKNMRLYRQNRGMNQSELGELLGGIPRQHVSNMERGSRPISKKVALKLSKVFATSVEKFIGD